MTAQALIEPANRERLVQASLQARESAYARYSQFSVGAALLADDGTIICGANVENASYGLTICAERVAIHSAVARGQRRFRLLAVASAGAFPPCGACRQVLAEFCDDLPILLVDANQPASITEVRLHDLLPLRFRLDG